MEKSKNPMPPESVVEGIERFTDDLFKCAAKHTKGNFVISGLSAHIAMTLCALGAKGDTAEEMRKVLHHPESSTFENYKELVEYLNDLLGVTVTIVNKVCADNSIIVEKSFKKDLSSLFNTKLEEVDFANDAEKIVTSINDFCAKATENKIRKIISIDNIKKDSRLLLVNAIHFKANWLDPFLLEYTEPRPFHFNEKVVEDVPTMIQNCWLNYKDLKDLNAECVALLYRGIPSDFMFLIIRPYEINGLEVLEGNLEKLHFIYKNFLNTNQRQIILFLPKFKIENKVPMKDYLEKLGMVQAFSKTANFKGISKDPTLIPPLHIDEMIQNVFIEVNEKGTEAAAVTLTRLRGGGCSSEAYEFKVDRPFLYRIVNVTKNFTLFSGRIVKPEYN